MGHSLLGRLQKTREWKDVIALITKGAGAPEVAEKLIVATEKAFSEVQDDPTFKTVVTYMVDVAQAATAADPKKALAQLGIVVNSQTQPLDVAMGAQAYLDAQCSKTKTDSDFGEKAILALTSTLTEHMQSNQLQLFDQGESKTLSPLMKLKSPTEFGKFGEKFFGNLTHSSLDYFLSKDLGTHVGEGKRFATMNQMGQFQDAVLQHCKESAVITRQYCQGWFAKHLRESGGHISAEEAKGFGWFGMNKMRSEISGHHDRYECGP
jgi:hypothetical protein